MPARISTFENFLGISVISTKCGDFYKNFLDNKILEKCGNPILDTMFSQILTALIIFSIN